MQFYKVKKWGLSTTFALAIALISPVASADLVVVVSSKSSVTTLSSDLVGQIFLSKSVSFPNGETAIPIDQSDAPTREEFYRKVTGKDKSQLKAYWSQLLFTGKGKPPKAVADSAEVKKMIADNPSIIGYISKSAVDSSVKVVFTP